MNGKPVRALVDTGMPSSMLDLAAARRLGGDPDDPQSPHGKWGGIGGHAMDASVASFDSIAIGPEVIRHVRLRVGDPWRGMRDDVHEMGTASYIDDQYVMLLGAGFHPQPPPPVRDQPAAPVFQLSRRRGVLGAAADAGGLALRVRISPAQARSTRRMGQSIP